MRMKDDKIQIYDINADGWRDLTALDVESFENVVAAYGFLRMGLQRLLEVTLKVGQGKIESPYSVTDFNVTTFKER